MKIEIETQEVTANEALANLAAIAATQQLSRDHWLIVEASVKKLKQVIGSATD